MSGKTLEYCVLNVAASPHPPGIYQRILTLAADHETKYWGERSARISAPMGVEPGLYRGRVATWNDIDFTQPGVSKERLEEIDLREIGNNFPLRLELTGVSSTTCSAKAITQFLLKHGTKEGRRFRPGRLERYFSRS